MAAFAVAMAAVRSTLALNWAHEPGEAVWNAMDIVK